MKGLAAVALMVRWGPPRAGVLWCDPAGSLRVTLKVPFITVFMCPGLSCRNTNRPEQGPIYDARSEGDVAEAWTQPRGVTHAPSNEKWLLITLLLSLPGSTDDVLKDGTFLFLILEYMHQQIYFLFKIPVGIISETTEPVRLICASFHCQQQYPS